MTTLFLFGLLLLLPRILWNLILGAVSAHWRYVFFLRRASALRDIAERAYETKTHGGLAFGYLLDAAAMTIFLFALWGASR